MKGARLISLLALALTCAAGIATFSTPTFAEPARQLNTRVSMTVDAGFNSYIKENAWLPVRVTLVNSGDPIEGQVVVTNTRLATTQRYAEPVSLGRNVRRQVTLYVPATSDSYEVQLMSGGQVVASVTPVTRQLTPGDRLVLIASDPPDAFNFIGDVRAASGSTSALALLRLDQFPDRVAALDIADVIVFDNVDTNSLTQAQRDAIKQWVVGGGHLILSGGPNAQLVLGGFADLAPGRADQTMTNADVGALSDIAAPASLVALGPVPTQTVPVVRVQPSLPNVRALAGSEETPLILRRDVGRGIVDQLAFDPALAPLRDWSGRAALFAALLGGRVNVANDLGKVGEGEAASYAAAALSAASPPSALVVGGFFALYVLVIGPINFLILRRLRRQSWAWFTVPAVVIAFTGLGLLTGFRLRGNSPHVHRLSVTLGDATTRDAESFGVYGLFSPRRTDANFEVGRSLAQLVDEPRADDQTPPSVTIVTGEPSKINGMPLTNSEVRTVYARDGATLPGVSSSLTFIPGTSNTAAAIGGKIRNETPDDMQNCVLIAGKDYQAIGDLRAGAAADAKVNLVVGHPQSLLDLRSINADRDRLTGGRSYGYSAASRSSKPSSSSAISNSSGSKYPFEQNAPSITDALVNWQSFSDEAVRQDAYFGLVATVFGTESVGPGVYLGCWEPRDTTGAQISGAEYTDRNLRLWRLPIDGHLIEKGEALPADVFTWNVVATNSNSELNDNGLSLEPGEHVIALTPWFDLRTTTTTATIALNIEFATASTSLAGLHEATVSLYNWQTRLFDEVVSQADDTASQNTHTGPYLSPSGQIVMKLNAATESVTLSRIATSVEVPK